MPDGETIIRCLIVVPSLHRAGAETQAIDLANGLSERGHVVHLCSFEPHLNQKSRLSQRVCFHHFTRRGRYDRRLVASIADLIDAEDLQVIQGVMQFAALYGWRASLRARLRPAVVATIHTTVNVGLKEELFDRLIYRRMLGSVERVLFVCERQKAHWIEKFPELGARAEVVYNGVDTSFFHRANHLDDAKILRVRLGIPADATTFTCIAAFRPEKNHEQLIDVFASLPQTAHLILAGDGERRTLIEKRVDAASLTNRVHFLGNVADVRPVILASNATVLASTAVETFSIAMLESMALGVPMIAPRIGGLAEAIEHGVSGLLFPVGDRVALKDCLMMALQDRARLIRLGAAAEARVAQNFSLHNMISGTEHIYLNVLANWEQSMQ